MLFLFLYIYLEDKFMKKPQILITNDDGIHAPGIRCLWRALKDFAEVTVIAPAYEQSGSGLAITFHSPLRIEKVQWDSNTLVWSVNGTPADCVKLGLNVLFKKKPDLIVSGINKGSNAGRNVLYSGTVGGAIEGVLQGIPAIAFSCLDYLDPGYKKAEEHIPSIVNLALANSLPPGTLLNVNFPKKEIEQIRGIKLTRQGKEFWTENLITRPHPEEGDYYWLGLRRARFEEEEDCDISWLEQGYIAAVPIHIDQLTDQQYLSEKKSSFENLFV
jgi:5'-nucleotidase